MAVEQGRSHSSMLIQPLTLIENRSIASDKLIEGISTKIEQSYGEVVSHKKILPMASKLENYSSSELRAPVLLF
jgi:hypothetical protein